MLKNVDDVEEKKTICGVVRRKDWVLPTYIALLEQSPSMEFLLDENSPMLSFVTSYYMLVPWC